MSSNIGKEVSLFLFTMSAILHRFRGPFVQAILIAALACLVYSGTFSVPFQFDDKLNIVDNPLIKDLSNFWPPSGVRWFGYLTFALNYAFNGLDPRGYHAVNLVIHVLNAFLVYWLMLLTFKTPWYSRKETAHENERTWHELTALFTALLFAVHPVQTQAVTYIVQRLASLATLLCLLSITAYIQARLISAARKSRDGGSTRMSIVFFYAVAVLSAVLAMKTKEISFTLPVVIILYEFFFFTADPPLFSKKLLYLLPLVLTLAIIPFTMTGFSGDMLSAFTATNEISRHDYLLTQFRVLVTYLRLLVLPVNQSVDHNYPVYHEFLAAPVLLSFLFLALLAGFGVHLAVRARRARPARLIAFGIFWFFITISVESSIVPIADIMFEHRLYLPSVGAAAAVTAGMAFLAEKLQSRHRHALTAFLAGGIVVVITLAAAAFSRNIVWQSEIALWENAVERHPEAARALSMLGIQYGAVGRRSDAINAYRKAIAAKPAFAEAHVNLGSAYVEEGLLDEGMNEFMKATSLRNMDAIDTANLYINIGYCFERKGMPDRAIEFYNYALPMVPDDAGVYFFLGRAYQAKGMNARAGEFMSKAHQLNPDKY